jgi:two-component system chemotaxis response regulator CheY
MKTILIVDDFSSQRSMLKMYLSNTGLEFAEASNGREALEYLATNNVIGVITDLEMPEMDGLELVRKIRLQPKFATLPVIMITSVNDSRPKAMAAGVTAWIHKPFQREYLLEVINNTMGKAAQIKEHIVLLIDDVNLQTTIWSKTLKMDHFKFVETNSAQEGLNALRAQKIDVILTDYLMPQVDGMRFIRKIKSMPEFASIPILMITTDQDMADNPPPEVVRVFKKPFNPMEVKQELRKCLGLQ